MLLRLQFRKAMSSQRTGAREGRRPSRSRRASGALTLFPLSHRGLPFQLTSICMRRGSSGNAGQKQGGAGPFGNRILDRIVSLVRGAPGSGGGGRWRSSVKRYSSLVLPLTLSSTVLMTCALPAFGSSGGVTATFRVTNPVTPPYNLWSVTGGAGYYVDRPIRATGGTDPGPGGYYLAGGRPTMVTNMAVSWGARVESTGGLGANDFLLIANLAPVDPGDTYMGTTSPGTLPGAGWIAHGVDGSGVMLVTVGVVPNTGGTIGEGRCYAGGGGAWLWSYCLQPPGRTGDT